MNNSSLTDFSTHKNMKYKNDKLSITLLSNSYIMSTKRIEESEMNIRKRTYDELRPSRIIVTHLRNVAKQLEEKERIIIENEVLLGKKGKWYLEYFSSSCYYRTRKKAYRDFLRIIEE